MMARSHYTTQNPKTVFFPKVKASKVDVFAALLLNGLLAKSSAAAAAAAWTAAGQDRCPLLRNNPDKLIHELNSQITLPGSHGNKPVLANLQS